MVEIEKGTGRPDAYKASGKRVPSVTTILSRFKESGGLIAWAYKTGHANGSHYEDGVHSPIGQGRRNELYKSDTAKEIGSVVHDAVETHIHGGEGLQLIAWSAELSDEDKAMAEEAFTAFTEWEKMMAVEYVATEVPLVSEEHRFAGTIDCIARINGKLVVLDWKTSKAVYSDMMLQCAAYALLWEECRGEAIDVGHLCRFAKSGAFSHHMWPERAIAVAKEQFLDLVKCYRRDKQIGRMM